jgi:hypothetical protein
MVGSELRGRRNERCLIEMAGSPPSANKRCAITSLKTNWNALWSYSAWYGICVQGAFAFFTANGNDAGSFPYG